MKNIIITLTETEAIVLYRFLNLISSRSFYEKTMAMKDKFHSFKEDFKGLEKETESVLQKNYTVWTKINNELQKQGVDPNKNPAPAIKIGDNEVEFKDGGVQVGCTFVAKETVEAVYKRLTEKE
jgi:hypothetical protein